MRRIRCIIVVYLLAASLIANIATGIATSPDAIQADETVWSYGCFTDNRWVRSAPNLTARVVGQISAWTPVKYQRDSGDFGLCQIGSMTGYVHLGLMISLSMTDPLSEDISILEGVTTENADCYIAPTERSPKQAQIPSGSRVQLRMVSDAFGQITLWGKSYFIPASAVQAQDIRRSSLASPTDLYASVSVPLRSSPWYGSAATDLPSLTPVQAVAKEGNELIVAWNDQVWYADSNVFCPVPAMESIQPIPAVLNKASSLLHFPLRNSPEVTHLPEKTELQIEGISGDYFYGHAAQGTGYLLISSVQRTGEVAAFLSQQEELRKNHQFLDIALSMLEEDNPILLKYKATAQLLPDDRLTKPQPYALGIPYLFGGMNIRNLGHIMYGPANSLYYSTDKQYFGGLDCIGFARTVHRQWGMPRVPKISSIPAYGDHLLDLSQVPLDQWHEHLQPGDCFAMRKRKSRHIALYLGTLRSMGFTEKEVGEGLKNFMEYPLVIHVGMNNYATKRYSDYIQAKKLHHVTPPDGGITISLLAPYHEAARTGTMWEGTPNEITFHWTDLQGYPLLFMDLMDEGIQWWVVYRNDPNHPPRRDTTPATNTNISAEIPLP